jgi:undecaprenyl-diphosphatase
VAENRRVAARWMEAHAATRWLVELTRRYRPQLEFLWDRVTPGGTFGLEFTSLMAVLAVALFVLVAYMVVIGREPGPTPGDNTAIEVVEHLRGGWLTSVSRVITALGSAWFTWGLTGVCAALFAARRRWTEFWVLLAGMTLIAIGIHEVKALVERPRPPEPLTAASGHSYPSGHAAHSVLYLWLAVTIVLRLRPGMTRAAAVVAAGVALTILVGLSRVYLNVHYLSDVSGGWALGAAAFSLCAAAALVISQVRQNPRQ